MSASAAPVVPFSIFVHNSNAELREMHLTFTAEFQEMSVDQRLECIRNYLESMLTQAKTVTDMASQRGLMTVIELTEELLPHIQSDNMPLHETLIVEMGEAADGSSLDELLN